MRFLFRAPLFDLDPRSIKEISAHWPQVVKAIKNSSESFYQEIKSVSFPELSERKQRKVIKYLLRGRFRSTPFGYWAGVGVGEFGDDKKNELDLSEVLVLNKIDFTSNSTEKHEHYYVGLEGFKNFGRNHYLSYLNREERWAFVSIPSNPLTQKLEKILSQDNEISYSKFEDWYSQWPEQEIEELWTQLLEMGIIQKTFQRREMGVVPRQKIDLVFKEKIALGKNSFHWVQDFWATAGNLFTETKSSYIQSFHYWFQEHFDDRFVPLPILLNYPDFVYGNFLNQVLLNSADPSGYLNYSGLDFQNPVDLKSRLTNKPVSDAIYDLNFLIRKCNRGRLLVENLVCNKPFSYFGRFNRYGPILNCQKEIRDTVFRNQDIIYAELKIVESGNVQGICQTAPLFQYYISPMRESDPGAISLCDLELGIREGNILIYQLSTGKRVVPVVTHPLNGREISHPLIKLIWELNQGQSYRLGIYEFQSKSFIPHSPQFQWGNLILQCRKWKIYAEWFSVRKDLEQWLIRNQIPCPIKIGIFDRELLINWEKNEELQIFWEELRKKNKLTLSDPIWLEDNSYISKESARTIYPEFAINFSREKKEWSWEGFINSISSEDKESLYFLIKIHEEDLWDFLIYYFSRELIEYVSVQKIVWYFLVYPESGCIQVRIRFLRVNSQQKKELFWLGYGKVRNSFYSIELRPYYPEIKKYGAETYKISEELFHLESQLLIEAIKFYRDEELRNRFFQAISLKLWSKLIQKTFSKEGAFRFLQLKVKSIPYEQKKDLLQNSIDLDFMGSFLELGWEKNYESLFLNLLNLKKEEEERFRVVGNHIHMMANRFFGEERQSMEFRIYIELHKLIRKELFKRVKGTKGRS